MAERHYRALIRKFVAEAMAPEAEVKRSFGGIEPEFPSAVVDAMAEFSSSSLSVFDPTASRKVWDADRLRELVLRLPPGRVRFLVQDPKAIRSPASVLPALSDLRKAGLLQVRTADPGLRGRPCLVVADERHVLVERAGDKAMCFLNDAEIGPMGAAAFEILWSRSIPRGPGARRAWLGGLGWLRPARLAGPPGALPA